MLRIQDDMNQTNEPGVCLTCVTIDERQFVQVHFHLVEQMERLVLYRYSSLFHYMPYI